LESKFFEDERGFSIDLNSDGDFNYRYISISWSGVARGLHYQKDHPQRKKINVLSGRILDVQLDLNSLDPSKLVMHELACDSGSITLNPNLAHGFFVLDGPAIDSSFAVVDRDHNCTTNVTFHSKPSSLFLTTLDQEPLHLCATISKSGSESQAENFAPSTHSSC
jgi:hypothetical protein